MKIELQIGTIELDSLPPGVDADALRSAVATELERLIRQGGVEWFGAAVPPASEALSPPHSTIGLSQNIAETVYRGFGR